jgi:hypothetical protein
MGRPTPDIAGHHQPREQQLVSDQSVASSRDFSNLQLENLHPRVGQLMSTSGVLARLRQKRRQASAKARPSPNRPDKTCPDKASPAAGWDPVRRPLRRATETAKWSNSRSWTLHLKSTAESRSTFRVLGVNGPHLHPPSMRELFCSNLKFRTPAPEYRQLSNKRFSNRLCRVISA